MTTSEAWNAICHPPTAQQTWALFHENSKVGPCYVGPPDEAVAAQMRLMWECFPYQTYPGVALPSVPTALPAALDTVIRERTSVRSFTEHLLSQADLASLLEHSYGVNRPESDEVSRSFRVIPSPGGLYPLEIFVYSSHVDGLAAGLYHYNPPRGELRLLREGDLSTEIAGALVQGHLAADAALLIFITAVFERVTFKYGDRGYRFALLEAGHLAQNINLVSCALKLGSVNLGGYFDREVDELLGLDGLDYSTVYVVAVGKPAAGGPVEDSRGD